MTTARSRIRLQMLPPNMTVAITAACLLAGSISAQASGQAEPNQTEPNHAEASQSQSPRFETAEQLLDALETADRGIDSLTSPIVYRKFFAIQSDEQRRHGTLYFQTDRFQIDRPDTTSAEQDHAPALRRFAVSFTELTVADRREKIDQQYAFDGEWVVEKTPADRQFTKRQVVPPGEDFDPLRIGEGPFPVPVGQQKADILERFDADLRPTAESLTDPALKALAEGRGLVQLRLVPRVGTPESRDFEQIRIWYEPEGNLLPRIARTVTPIGDESEVVLLRPSVNEPIDPAIFSTKTPPPEEGWNISISDYRQPVAPN